MPIRKHKKFKKPKKPFDSARIKEEDGIIKKYGLKNKREIWRAESAIENIRKQAKLLLTKSKEEQDEFIDRLKTQGFVVASIADVLALDKQDYLKRRLQSVVVEKKLATTLRQARQLIVHKHVTVNKNIVNIPSYLVPVNEENSIELKIVRKEKKKENKLPLENVDSNEEGEKTIEEPKENEGEKTNA